MDKNRDDMADERAADDASAIWHKARNAWMAASRHGTQEDADAAAIAVLNAARPSSPNAATFEKEIGQLIDERDSFEHMGTVLADKVSELFDTDIGEWSSANNPIFRAIHIVEEQIAATASSAAPVDMPVEQCEAVRRAIGYVMAMNGPTSLIRTLHIISEGRNAARASSPNAAGTEEPTIPAELHPDTAKLVRRFTRALANKLLAAQRKYGYSDNWMRDGWADECRGELMRHVHKGDPRDVAAYCAFLWHHNESTAPAQAVEPVAIPAGWKLVRVNEYFDALIEALERADSKGYMPDVMRAPWEAFACDENVVAPQPPAQADALPEIEPPQAGGNKGRLPALARTREGGNLYSLGYNRGLKKGRDEAAQANCRERLTDERIDEIARPFAGLGGIEDYRAFARALFAAHPVQPEPRAEMEHCGCATNEACKMKTDGSCWRAD